MLFRSLEVRPRKGRSVVGRRTRRRRESAVVPVAGLIETLEDRTLLSVQFVFDYSYDTAGFFDDQARRDVLEQAGADLGRRLYDELDDLTASGANSWSATFINPETGVTASESDLVVAADTLYVFAGARDLDGDDVGRGGYGGFSATGDPDWLDRVRARGQDGALLPAPTDFGPWGGSITFDSLTTWHFGPSTTGLDLAEIDFYSVAVHELGHLLGISNANPSWTQWINEAEFEGPAALAEFDGLANVPLAADDGHWGEGVTDDGQEAAMDPSLASGERKEFTELDFAGLVDLGWALLPETYTIDVADGSAHSILIEDDTIASDYRSRVTIDGSETVTFLVPADVLTINGADGDDTITLAGMDAEFTARIVVNGQDGDDTISALPAFDWDFEARGGNGNDSLAGGDGDDTLNGDAGADVLSGGEGDDELNGGDAADHLAGGPGADVLDGGDGDGDTLIADGGDDTLDGGAGIDQVEAESDADFTLSDNSLDGLGADVLTDVEEVKITAGPGANLLDATAFSGTVTLFGAGGADTLRGGSGADLLVGNSGEDTLEGGDGNDRLLGGSSTDWLDGGSGDDLVNGQGGQRDSLIGGDGDDTLDGGAGIDWVVGPGGGDWVLADTVLTGAGTDVLLSVERGELAGDEQANTIDASGFSGNVTIRGGGGDDTLVGGSGFDMLNGQGGNDSLVAGDGDDRLYGGSGNDWLEGGSGDDRIKGNGGNLDTLVGGLGDDELIGGGGTGDVAWETLDGDLVLVDGQLSGVGTDTLSTVETVELVGGAGNNVLDASGYSGDVILRGEGGDDTLLAGAGSDLLDGGDGNDQLEAGAGADVVRGGDGTDSLDGGAGNDLLQGQGDEDRLGGGSGDDTLQGGDGDDLLAESANVDFVLTVATLPGLGSDTFSAIEGVELTGGDDGNSIDATSAVVPVTLIGGAGADTLRGGAAADVLNGSAGNDSAVGGDGDDTLLGGIGDDSLAGELGDDVLLGQGGDDLIDGGDGDDRVSGTRDTDWTLSDLALDGDGSDSLVSIEKASLNGGDGDNLIDATEFSGPTTLSGAAGNDTLRGGSGDDVLDGGLGNDRMAGHDGNDRANGRAGNDVILGQAGDDKLLGGSGADSILGGDGDDTVKGHSGVDRLCGGDGDNRVVGTAAEIDDCFGDCFDDICLDV